jgi:hypothetical protein
MKIINKLIDVYNDWIDKNKLEHISADEVLMGTPNLTEKQKEWLKEFIEVWDKGNDVEDWLDKNEVKNEKKVVRGNDHEINADGTETEKNSVL